MIHNTSPAGLFNDGSIEIFVLNGDPACVYQSKVYTWSEFPEVITESLREQLNKDYKALKGLYILGIVDPEEQLKRYTFCHFGDFDKVPDRTGDGKFNPEYWDCGHRPCLADGLLCHIPEVPGGNLTPHEVKIIRLIAQDLPRSQARHRTLVSVVFISTVPLLKKYATFVENSSLPFTCVSSVTDPESGLTAINVSGCSEAPEMELKILATRFLSEKFGEFQPSCVEAVRVFQSSERIPVYPLNEKVEPIPARVGEGRLFLASRELGYGRPVSMNTDLLLARKAVEAFLECAPTFVCGVRPAALAAAR